MAVISNASPVAVAARKADDVATNDVTIASIDSARWYPYPIALFNDDYTECNGILSEMSPACTSIESTKKRTANDVGRMRGVASSSSPPKKIHASPSTSMLNSPRRRSVIMAAATLAASVDPSVVLNPSSTPNYHPLSIVRRVQQSSTPFDDIINPLPKKKKGPSEAKLGLVSLSGFEKDFRPIHYASKTVYGEKKVQSDLKTIRRQMLYRFSPP